MNKLYFDGELDFKTKAGLKEGMSKEKSNAENGTQEKVQYIYLLMFLYKLQYRVETKNTVHFL